MKVVSLVLPQNSNIYAFVTTHVTLMSTVAPSATGTVNGRSATPWSKTKRPGTGSRMVSRPGRKSLRTCPSTTTLRTVTTAAAGTTTSGNGSAPGVQMTTVATMGLASHRSAITRPTLMSTFAQPFMVSVASQTAFLT